MEVIVIVNEKTATTRDTRRNAFQLECKYGFPVGKRPLVATIDHESSEVHYQQGQKGFVLAAAKKAGFRVK